MQASASIPPTPQPTTPSPLIMVVWLSVPTRLSGSATPSFTITTLGEIFEIHLMHDSGGRRDDAEVLKRLLSPFQEFIALAIALEFLLHVVEEGGGGAVIVDLHGVVDDQIDRNQRIDFLRIAARLASSPSASPPDRPPPALR